MTGPRAVFYKETVELLPGMLIAMAVALLAGYQYWNPYGHESAAPVMIMIAAAVGAAHGALDRRRARNLFDRHRPVAESRLHGARWAAGSVAVVLAFTSLQVGRFLGRAMADPGTLLSLLGGQRQNLSDPWALPGALWVFGASLLAWCCVRAAVSWRGVVGPILLVVLLPVATDAAVTAADPASLPAMILLIVVYSMLPLAAGAKA